MTDTEPTPPPPDLFILHMGSEAEPHTMESLVERLRGLMHHGNIKPGYCVERWYRVDKNWERADDEWPVNE